MAEREGFEPAKAKIHHFNDGNIAISLVVSEYRRVVVNQQFPTDSNSILQRKS